MLHIVHSLKRTSAPIRHCVFDELAFVMTENWEEFWEVGNPQTEPDPSGKWGGTPKYDQSVDISSQLYLYTIQQTLIKMKLIPPKFTMINLKRIYWALMSTKQCINYQLRIDQVLQSISIAFPQELHLKVSGDALRWQQWLLQWFVLLVHWIFSRYHEGKITNKLCRADKKHLGWALIQSANTIKTHYEVHCQAGNARWRFWWGCILNGGGSE